MVDQRHRSFVKFVRRHSQLHTLLCKSFKQFWHTLVWASVICNMRLIIFDKCQSHPLNILCRAILRRQCTFNQLRDTVSDKHSVGFGRMRRVSKLLQRMITRRRQVANRIKQRAVKVEYYKSNFTHHHSFFSQLQSNNFFTENPNIRLTLSTWYKNCSTISDNNFKFDSDGNQF